MTEFSSQSPSERFFDAWRQFRRGEIVRGLSPLFENLVDPPLSSGESDILQALVFRPEGVSMNELASMIAADRGNTTRAIEQLVQTGLLRRLVGEHDRRIRRVTLTRAGQALAQRHVTQRAEVFAAAMGVLGRRKGTQFVDDLEAVIGAIQAFIDSRRTPNRRDAGVTSKARAQR